MEERLRYILSSVNEWLKFAEAKNGALLAANVGILFGAFRFVGGMTCTKACIYSAIISVIVSTVVALASFIPRLKMPSFTSKKRPTKETSLIFFGHIARYDPEDYVRALYSEAGVQEPTVTSIENDYSRQIITNSQIALQKYRCFSVGLWLTVLALLLLLVPVLLSTVAMK